MLTDSTRKYLCRVEGLYDKNNTLSLLPYCACFLNMFTGACKITENKLELVASYFTVKSTDFFFAVNVRLENMLKRRRVILRGCEGLPEYQLL